MSQTHIFNFFPGSIHCSRILKTLSLFASRQKNTYLPNQQIWLNRLYFQISNSKEKKCLTIDTREVNQLGPGKFRTSADNGQEQTCYFNRSMSDSHFNSYTAKRAFPDKWVFSIVKVNSDFNLINKSLEIEVKTNSFVNDRAKRQHQQVDRGDFSYGKKSRIETGADRRAHNRLDTSNVPESALSRREPGGGGNNGREMRRKKTKFITSS